MKNSSHDNRHHFSFSWGDDEQEKRKLIQKIFLNSIYCLYEKLELEPNLAV